MENNCSYILEDIWFEIFTYLSISELKYLYNTNHMFRNLTTKFYKKKQYPQNPYLLLEKIQNLQQILENWDIYRCACGEYDRPYEYVWYCNKHNEDGNFCRNCFDKCSECK